MDLTEQAVWLKERRGKYSSHLPTMTEVEELLRKIEEAEKQRDELQADNKLLREEVEYWKTLHAQDVNTLKEELREAEKAQDFCFSCGKDLNGT